MQVCGCATCIRRANRFVSPTRSGLRACPCSPIRSATDYNNLQCCVSGRGVAASEGGVPESASGQQAGKRKVKKTPWNAKALTQAERDTITYIVLDFETSASGENGYLIDLGSVVLVPGAGGDEAMRPSEDPSDQFQMKSCPPADAVWSEEGPAARGHRTCMH